MYEERGDGSVTFLNGFLCGFLIEDHYTFFVHKKPVYKELEQIFKKLRGLYSLKFKKSIV